MNNQYDFIISGAGLVGALTALQLSNNGYSCCLIEKNNLSENKSYKNYSPLSLNYRSFLILNNFGIWDSIKDYAYPVNRLQIKSFNSLNRLSFESRDIGLDVLGYVVDRRRLLSNFLDLIEKESKIDLIQGDFISDLITKEKSIEAHLESKQIIGSKNLIVSDGVNSTLKDLLNIESRVKDHFQSSYVYNARGSFVKNSAIQIFNKYGIFAGIPYTKDSINLVLSVNHDHERELINDGDVKIDTLTHIFKGYVDSIHELDFVSKYPLVAVKANQIIKKNILLIGNSSQLLHPVGAQGFNLALRNIDCFINNYNTNLNIDDVSSTIEKDRKSVFTNIDFATEVFGGNKITSKIFTFAACNLLKSSSYLQSKFLEKILGIESYPYLTIGTK